jgi:peptidyl-prolyl cis-trans isomerase C
MTPITDVRVDGAAIPVAAIDAEVQYHPASGLDGARRAATRALVLRTLLLQEAARRGITEPDAADPSADDGPETHEDGLIRTVLAHAIRLPEPDEAACQRYYEKNRKRFRCPDLYEGAHILFAAAPNDPQARAAAKARAETALARLADDPKAFDALAAELSACPSGKTGGRLGQIARGDTAPELETFMFALEEGQICPLPVKTRYGFHVIRLDRKIEGRQLPYQMTAVRIATYLRDNAWRRAASQFIQLLVGQAKITGVSPDEIGLIGAATPLVQ